MCNPPGKSISSLSDAVAYSAHTQFGEGQLPDDTSHSTSLGIHLMTNRAICLSIVFSMQYLFDRIYSQIRLETLLNWMNVISPHTPCDQICSKPVSSLIGFKEYETHYRRSLRLISRTHITFPDCQATIVITCQASRIAGVSLLNCHSQPWTHASRQYCLKAGPQYFSLCVSSSLTSFL